MTISNLSIKGIQLADSQVTAVLRQLSGAGFSKADFAQTLVRQGLSAGHDGDFVRRLMQHLKQAGLIDFDATAQIWQFTDLGRIRAGKTLPMPASPQTTNGIWGKVTAAISLSLRALACIGLVAALITLNASFAWELGREAGHFRAAFVMALMALDLMRPFLMTAGFALATNGRLWVAATAFTIGIALSPVSILSSTAIISSSVLLGAEMNSDETARAATLETLRGEHARILGEAERTQAAWAAECDRGGCGPVAASLETEFTGLASEAQVILDRILSLTEATSGTSALLARMVETFEQLGLFAADRQIWLPLFLALSLELGALFGPALLLTRSRP